MTQRLLYDTKKEAKLESVREIRVILLRLLNLKRLGEVLSNRISLAFTEAATNIIKHGYPKAATLQVTLSQDVDHLYLAIMDDGESWDITSQPYQGLDSVLQDHESGRGIELINAFVDTVDYQPYHTANFHCLNLSWSLPEKCHQSRILIIEDELVAQNLYRSYLSERYQIDIVADGMQALTQFQKHDYDLLLSDINMPHMDGMSLREQLLEQKKGQLTPFIFLTAADNSQLVERANFLGVDDYLQKPVNKNQLLQSVDRAIYRSVQLKKAMGEMINERICGSLLPQMPFDIPYWQCQLQQSHSERGGGDIFHLHPFKDETGTEASLIMLADVEGHDETAKFFSHAFAGYLRGIIQGYLDGASAASIVVAVSIEHLMQQISNGIYMDRLLSQSTITLLLLSVHSGGIVRIVSAGHPAPFILGAGSMRQLDVGGLLPGLIENARYQMMQVEIKQSERIVLYTDGLLESKTLTQRFVESDILQQLNESIDHPPDRAARQLIEHFEQLVDPHTQDDATLILLQAK